MSGPPDAPPLVLLPPASCHSLFWIPEIEAYSRDFRTFAVDPIYDSGRSVDYDPVAKTADALDWLDALFDALGLREGINLLGQSQGGWLTVECALHLPERLGKAVVLGPPGVAVRPSGEFVARMMAMLVPSRSTIGPFMRWVMPVAASAGGETQAAFDRVIDDAVLAAKCYRRKAFVQVRVLSDDELRSISVPMLYLEAEHERVCSPADVVARLREVAPQIQTAIIPGADHSFGGVEPEAVHRTVLDFLTGQGEGRGLDGEPSAVD